MAYLQPTEYASFGLPAGTSADWITSATALINSHCRRPDLNVTEYTERLRITDGTQRVRLSYLPLAPLGAATTALISVQGRYGVRRRGELAPEPLMEMAMAFALPGQWSAIDISMVDYDANSGELSLPWGMLGLPFGEVMVNYTAGLSVIGDDIKSACAQIVRNAQATPALNARRSKIDTMQVEYFSSSLIDETVQAWLKPYVANRLG